MKYHTDEYCVASKLMLLSKRQKNAQNVFKAGFTLSKKYPNVILIHFTKILNFTSIKVTYTIVLVIDFVF